MFEIDRRWDHPVSDGQKRSDDLIDPRYGNRMAGHGFERGDRDVIGQFPKHLFDGQGFVDIIGKNPIPMGIDVIDFQRGNLRLLHGPSEILGHGSIIRIHPKEVKRFIQSRITDHFSVNVSALSKAC